jgi:hypothetical protein
MIFYQQQNVFLNIGQTWLIYTVHNDACMAYISVNADLLYYHMYATFSAVLYHPQALVHQGQKIAVIVHE